MKIYINSPTNDLTIQLSEPVIGYSSIKLLQCTLHNSWFNITNANNILTYYNGKEWIKKKITPGNYNVDTLSKAVTHYINFKMKPATGKILITLDDNYKIDFTEPNNFAELLGFDSEVIESSKVGKHRADFLTVKEYVLHCDVIDSPKNYFNGKRINYLQVLPMYDTEDINKRVIYNFDNATGVAIKSSPIYNIHLWITDGNNIPIDFNGYPITYQLEFS